MSLPDRTAILERVGEWSELVDRAIATGVHRHVGRIGEWDTFEWQASLDELLKLSSSTDAYYDRPTIGPAYALWYHARRVNPLVSQLERIVRLADERRHPQVDVVDLGAGTGAVAWAAALVAGAVVELGHEPPQVVVHEVESSPLMTATADSLWETLGEELDAFGYVDRVPQPVSWPLAEVDSDAPVWLLASFLLDHTDKHRAEEMAKSLHRVVDRCGAEGVVFTVTRSKLGIATSAIDQLEQDHEWEGRRRQASLQWEGLMAHTAATRRELYTSFGLGDSGLLKNSPTFDGDSLSVREATRPVGAQAALFASDAWMALTDEQEDAAGIDFDQSVLALGAAGSGKSIVVIERLARLVTRRTVGAPRRILVTTFNNDMVSQLARWLEERLTHEGLPYKRRRNDGHIIFSEIGSGRDTIELLNWDKAPTRLLHIKAGGVAAGSWRKRAEKEVQRLRLDRDRFGRIGQDDRVADAEFLRAEQSRVVYGLGALTRVEYETVERTGRGRAIGPVQREFAWEVMDSVGPDVFLARRIAMLELARAGELPRLFTDIYVDEVQDFTPSDIECLLAMHDGTGAVLYAGDEAQALHLGLSYRRPRPVHGTWVQGRIVRLEGSHRLPVPIARCVGPLVDAAIELRIAARQSADDLSPPNSRKASVIGVRPVLVVGDEEHLAAEIRRIVETYRGYLEAEFGSDRITVCESDPSLTKAIGTPRIESATVMGIKGLERGMVVWSARRPPTNSDEALETAYTVMTRTSCLLVLAVDPEDLPAAHLDVIRHLERDHVMRWDQRAEAWWKRVVLRSESPAEKPPPDAPTPVPDPGPDAGGDGASESATTSSSNEAGWWDEGEECPRHELGWCSLCKPRDLPKVVRVTRGKSDAFHKTATCPALVSGQRLVEAAGGTAADIETVALETAISLDKFPCLVCFPGSKGKL